MHSTLLIAMMLLPLFANANDLEISNFKSGLACTNSSQVAGSIGWICQPTELILVTDQGSCVFNKEKQLCTWYGFEFDYASKLKDTKLQCALTRSLPGDSGNPSEIVVEDSLGETYEIELPEKNGHFFNPQYTVFNLQDATDDDLIMETTCKHQGEIMFTFKFRLHFPLVEQP